MYVPLLEGENPDNPLASGCQGRGRNIEISLILPLYRNFSIAVETPCMASLHAVLTKTCTHAY